MLLLGPAPAARMSMKSGAYVTASTATVLSQLPGPLMCQRRSRSRSGSANLPRSAADRFVDSHVRGLKDHL